MFLKLNKQQFVKFLTTKFNMKWNNNNIILLIKNEELEYYYRIVPNFFFKCKKNLWLAWDLIRVWLSPQPLAWRIKLVRARVLYFNHRVILGLAKPEPDSAHCQAFLLPRLFTMHISPFKISKYIKETNEFALMLLVLIWAYMDHELYILNIE